MRALLGMWVVVALWCGAMPAHAAEELELAVIVQRATGLRSSIGFRPVPLDDPFYGAAAWAVRTLEPESGSLYWTVYR